MAGMYICAKDDGRIAELNGFLRIKILEFNLLLFITGRQENPSPGVLTQEFSRFNNITHIATRMMQSLIFPPEIVSEMNEADHCNHQILTPHSLYKYIIAVLKPLNPDSWMSTTQS